MHGEPLLEQLTIRHLNGHTEVTASQRRVGEPLQLADVSENTYYARLPPLVGRFGMNADGRASLAVSGSAYPNMVEAPRVGRRRWDGA